MMNVTETPGRNELYLSCRLCEAEKMPAKILIGLTGVDRVQAVDYKGAPMPDMPHGAVLRWHPTNADVSGFMRLHSHDSLFPFELSYRFDAAYAKRENEHAEAIRALEEQLRVRPVVEVQTSGKKNKVPKTRGGKRGQKTNRR